MFGPKREEVTKAWRKLHNEELHPEEASSLAFRNVGILSHHYTQ
jgi:hypothetical protein